MKKTKLSIYFLFIAIFTFVALFTAIVQSSYSNLINPVKEVKKNNLLNPINSNLDLDVIEQVESKKEYSNSNFGVVIDQVSTTSASPSADLEP